MNVLLVGLGRWGENHLRVLGQLGVTLWVADISPERLASAIRRRVAPDHALADYRAGLEAVDAGDIVTCAELQAFLDACAGRASKPVPAAVGVRALDVLEAAERSARLGADVVLPATP